MNLNFWHYIAILALGTVAGIMNIIAGGGSNLILPLLMAFGIPTDIANGSNRVGILLHALTGIRSFAKAGKIPPKHEVIKLLIPTLIGGLIGAIFASVLSHRLLKPILLIAMLLVAGLMLFRPNLLEKQENTTIIDINKKPKTWILLLSTGIYGGFVQAGVGLLMIPIFAGLLHYDAVRANALKTLCTLGFTIVSVFVFCLHGQIWWHVGITLALGNIFGALLGVRFSLTLPPQIIRWFIFIMTLGAVLIAIIRQ